MNWTTLFQKMGQLMTSKEQAQGCPGEDLVLTYASGFFSAKEEKKAQEHFSICPFCIGLLVQQKSTNEKPFKFGLNIPTLVIGTFSGVVILLMGMFHMYYDYKLANGRFLFIDNTLNLFIVGSILFAVSTLALHEKANIYKFFPQKAPAYS